MASDCELLIDLPESRIGLAKHLADIAIREVWRIEQKYSRYLTDNVFAQMHKYPGSWQKIDDETYLYRSPGNCDDLHLWVWTVGAGEIRSH